MNIRLIYGMIMALTAITPLVVGQQVCDNGVRVEGTVMDPTGAVIPGAQVRGDDQATTATDASGHFLLPCIPVDSKEITAQAEGFTAGAAAIGRQVAGSRIHVDIRLAIANVETIVEVGGDANAVDADRGPGTITLNTAAVMQLADDPDDFRRQLQALSASGGGNPASSLIMVDGFQNGSVIPSKSSIATIRVNPDLFSSEYQSPPFTGGVIEIATKPGADSFHGALFYTSSDSSFNAINPFSATPTPTGKQRYGFELSGPVLSARSGFALALEKRDINEFNIVNAMTLSDDGTVAPVRDAVSAPQKLWTGSARGDWQVNSKDVAVLSFSSNVNDLLNQGIGGLTLAEAGYSGLLSEYDLRFTNTLAPTANLLHETRIGYSWRRTKQSALSTAPSLQISGYFAGGGATSQNLNDRERDLEIDDDLSVMHGKHQFKVGVQSLGIFRHDYYPNNFNGAYIFGGGSAPVLDASNHPTSQTTTISAIEQYRRAQSNLAGGTPTTYQVTSGNPLIALAQWQSGMYFQDTIKVVPRLTVSAGVRYALQTSPVSSANFGPRLSVSWSPDRKQTWVFRARSGLFSGVISMNHALEVVRLNETRQKKVTVYSPSYTNPLIPVVGSTEVSAVQEFPRSLAQPLSYAGYFNMEHELPHRWNIQANFFLGESWNAVRIRNINAPMISSNGNSAPDPFVALLAARPIDPNKNILQYQNTGHFSGSVLSFVVDQHSYKYFNLFAYYAYRNSKTDGGTGDAIPQSSYSDMGEAARADWASTHSFFLAGNLSLAYSLKLTTQFDVQQGRPYSITTGTDNNGDGNFNDRPSYASVPGAGVYSTPFGLLTTNTVNGDVPRNLGTMPALIHMDTNLSRTFKLNPRDSVHLRTLTLNVRSANLLNHTNVTTVQTVLSSNLGQPLSSETARRVELGARFAF